MMIICPECGTECDEQGRFCPGCGASLVAAREDSNADPYIGQKIKGNFLIEKLLGEGGMGKVYMATQLSLDKQVAIKILHKHLFSADKTIALRFHREAKSASQIDHPNSIRIIDFGQMEIDSSLFIAMEFLKGRELTDIIQKDFPLTSERIAHILGQVAGVLAEAHSKGIVHRDMKPDNIIITPRAEDENFVKVLDFGIAKLMDRGDGPRLTMEGMVCGTPEYMAPEQAMGKDLDARADIYAVGCILYEMLTQHVPFEAANYQAILAMHVREAPQLPSQRRPDLVIDRDLEAICLRMLAKAPDDRFQSFLEVKSALDRVALRHRAPGTASLSPSDAKAPAPPPPPKSAPPPPPPPAAAPPTLAPSQPTLLVTGIDGSQTITAPQGMTLVIPQQKSNNGLIIGVAAGVVVLVVAIVVAVLVLSRPSPSPSPGSAEPTAASAVVAAPSPAASASPAPTAAPAEMDPARAQRLFDEGLKMMNEGQNDGALKYFAEAIRYNPSFAKAYKYTGDCAMQSGDSATAATAYRKYLTLKPDAPEKQFLEEFLKAQ